MYIGLTGSFAAGKDTVARFLVQKGFFYHSLSDLIREHLKEEGMEITRENLIKAGNEVRSEFGAGEWARRALAAAKDSNERNSLFVSIRNPGEVEVFKKEKNFQLWFVDAPARMRYERTIVRARPDDFKSFEEFLEREKQENSKNPAAQQLQKVASMADEIIVNDKDIDGLYKTIQELLTEDEHKLNVESA